MHRNPYWLVFLAMIALGTIGYSGYSLFTVWQYLKLDKQTEILNIQWSVAAVSDDVFIPQASYHYAVKGKNYSGQSLLKESYLNEWTAKEAIDRFSKEPLRIWYDASSPEYSSLEKEFPYKQSFSMVSLWIICLYFVCLNAYVKQRLPPPFS